MKNIDVLGYLALWGSVGVVIFSVFVVVAFRTGLVYTARKADGTLKNRIPWTGILAMTIIPLGLMGLHLLSTYFWLILKGISIQFWSLFLLNYGVYAIVFIYDTLVIDGFVLSLWRPKALRLPDPMGADSMRKHILISIPVGFLAGVILTLLSTGLASILWIH